MWPLLSHEVTIWALKSWQLATFESPMSIQSAIPFVRFATGFAGEVSSAFISMIYDRQKLLVISIVLEDIY